MRADFYDEMINVAEEMFNHPYPKKKLAPNSKTASCKSLAKVTYWIPERSEGKKPGMILYWKMVGIIGVLFLQVPKG